MKHVFIIQAHSNPEQIHRLVSKLEAHNHCFVIHIDKKFNELMDDPLIRQLSIRQNVSIISRNMINWGGASQFFTTIDCIREALSQWCDIEYIHLLSGQCYPIKSNDEIDSYFDKYNNMSFIQLADSTKMNQRLDIYYLRDYIDIKRCSLPVKVFNKIFELIQLSLLSIGIRFRKELDLKIYKGSNWLSLSRKAINYILNYVEQNPKILKRFKYTNCCDEIFFHTILYNSPIAHTLVNNNLRYIDWGNNGRGFPNVLDETDYEKIIESGKLFCRKIVNPQSDSLLSQLDAKIRNLQ